MNRIELLLRMLDTTFDKESWYAPLKPAIGGLTAEQARWRPEGDAANSIWENVNHLIYYKERLAANLEGHEWTHSPVGDETFYLTEQVNDEREWKAALERAEEAQHRVRKAVSQMAPEVLEQNALEEKLLDIMLHDAYHTGQIIQLRKMQGSWPSQR
jgi:uncharacterized damage-inducible protein DinB